MTTKLNLWGLFSNSTSSWMYSKLCKMIFNTFNEYLLYAKHFKCNGEYKLQYQDSLTGSDYCGHLNLLENKKKVKNSIHLMRFIQQSIQLIPISVTLPHYDAKNLQLEGGLHFKFVVFQEGVLLFPPPVSCFLMHHLQTPVRWWWHHKSAKIFCLKLCNFSLRHGKSKCNTDKLFNTGRTCACTLALLVSHLGSTSLMT